MPVHPFTDRWLVTVRADARVEFTDAGCPGLRVRVGPRGKTFYLTRKVDGRIVRRRIGDYPGVSLVAARAAASEPLRRVEPPRTATFAELVDFRLAQMETRSPEDIGNHRAYLRHGRLAAERFFGADTLAVDIRPEDVVAWLRRFAQAGVNTRAPRAYLSAAFTAARKADLDPASDHPRRFGVRENPVTLVGGATKVKPRDRVLSLDELRAVWHGFSGRNVAPATSLLLRCIIATGGLRVSEILRLRRDNLSTLAGEPWLVLPTTKNGRPHAIPLPQAAVRLFETARSFSSTDHLFPARLGADEPMALRTVSQAARRWMEARDDVAPFQPRDLRRTMKTRLIERDETLREPMKVWQNHGLVTDVADTHYDWCLYPQTKRRVRDAIDAFVETL